MPFIPHTQVDTEQMLKAIGEKSIEALFDEIPPALRAPALEGIPRGLTELELNQHIAKIIAQTPERKCYIGAGAYEHHIPAAVWQLASRGEFLTSYTPYQAEASQGTLQLLYEFQTMMTELTAMDVSNASLYDGGSALAEAVLMAVRLAKKKKTRKVLVAGSLHPHYKDTLISIVKDQQIECIDIPYDDKTGLIDFDALKAFDDEFTALVIAQPNFFGHLESVDKLTDFAHSKDALVIASVNPTSLALLKPPGEWGQKGVDIVCGEGQPLGVPLAFGGPYFGFICTRQAFVRQMPGRIIGATLDKAGNRGFSLTLQAREQHIRRSKATSNICTNQGLLVTAATIYMSLLGAKGLEAVAKSCCQKTKTLLNLLCDIDGVSLRFESHYFHEAVLKLDRDVDDVLAKMTESGIDAGLALGTFDKGLSNCLMVCVTETKTDKDIADYVSAFKAALGETKCL